MSTKDYVMTEELRKRWIAEGRGQGDGAAYHGWLTTTDVNSEGHKYRRNERINGHLCHWLSEVEYKVAKVYQCDWSVTALLDQFPLPIAETREIAKSLGIEHPRCKKTGVDINLTTDMVVEAHRNGKSILLPRNIKMSKDLQSFNQIEHAEIERRWWLYRGHELKFVNAEPRFIPPALLANADTIESAVWIHKDTYPYDGYFEELCCYLLEQLPLAKATNTVLDLCKSLDVRTGVSKGLFLRVLRNLIAHRRLRANLLDLPIYKQSVAELVSQNYFEAARRGA